MLLPVAIRAGAWRRLGSHVPLTGRRETVLLEAFPARDAWSATRYRNEGKWAYENEGPARNEPTRGCPPYGDTAQPATN
jgi:hypothetical protein